MKTSQMLAIACVALVLSLNTTTAKAASVIADQEARAAGGAIAECSSTKQGQPLIDCVGDAMAGLSSGLSRGDVPDKAPQASPLAGQAAAIRGKPKAQAATILNRVLSIARGLAAKSSGESQSAYNSVAGAFARALSAIERKG